MMKMKFAAYAFAIMAAVTVSASAQQATQAGTAGPIPDGKVAVINTAVFPTEIAELKQKYEQVDNQYKQRFEALQTLDQQLKALEAEIRQQGPTLNQDALRQKQDQYDTMKKRGTRDYEDLKAEVDKTVESATKPVRDKLYQFLQSYAQQRGIVMVINLPGAAQTGSLAFWHPGTDITADFVKEYNKANPVAGAAPSASVPKPAANKPAGQSR